MVHKKMIESRADLATKASVFKQNNCFHLKVCRMFYFLAEISLKSNTLRKEKDIFSRMSFSNFL